jgi:hypothetical protein
MVYLDTDWFQSHFRIHLLSTNTLTILIFEVILINLICKYLTYLAFLLTYFGFFRRVGGNVLMSGGTMPILQKTGTVNCNKSLG